MKSSAELTGNDRVAPLLKTKLEAPGFPPLVFRQNLIESLANGHANPLTLVYGPAGSGKTMLVAQWRASCADELPVAWLSLDAGDNDPARFWVYVVEALRSVSPGFGEAVLAMLRAPGAALVDGALLRLMNELVDVAGRAALVLDDYHAIEDERIHAGLASLLERLPNALRVVITSRVEPPLGIGTLRARGQNGPGTVAGMVLIAPAVDFTEELMWKRFSPAIRQELEENGVWAWPSAYAPEPYLVTRQLIEEGRNHLILGNMIETGCPVRILQGVEDPDVPWRHAVELVSRLASDDVVLTLVKDGDHRLSRPEDIERLIAAVTEF